MLPSTYTTSGCNARFATARSIASRLARRMLSRSISATSARPTPTASACDSMISASSARRAAVSLFRVAQARDRPRRIEDHRGGDDRTRKRTAADFVDTCEHQNRHRLIVEQIHQRSIIDNTAVGGALVCAAAQRSHAACGSPLGACRRGPRSSSVISASARRWVERRVAEVRGRGAGPPECWATRRTVCAAVLSRSVA